MGRAVFPLSMVAIVRETESEDVVVEDGTIRLRVEDSLWDA